MFEVSEEASEKIKQFLEGREGLRPKAGGQVHISLWLSVISLTDGPSFNLFDG